MNFFIEELELCHVGDNTLDFLSLIEQYDKDPSDYGGETSIVYCTPLLKHVDLHIMDLDIIHRMVSRCVEHNLREQLEYILSHKIDCDKNLLLRKIGSAEIYSYVQSFGYKDVELDKRIVWIQRRIREKKLGKVSETSKVSQKYEGPNIHDFYKNNRYYGYRNAIHKVRWDRGGRKDFYNSLMELGCWGNCEWQAYMDYLRFG